MNTDVILPDKLPDFPPRYQHIAETGMLKLSRQMPSYSFYRQSLEHWSHLLGDGPLDVVQFYKNYDLNGMKGSMVNPEYFKGFEPPIKGAHTWFKKVPYPEEWFALIKYRSFIIILLTYFCL